MYLKQISNYWDSRAEGYSITIHEQLETSVGKYFRRTLRENSPEGEQLDCLDIGCGPGFFSIILAQEGHRVTAVDYSYGMIEKAKVNFFEAEVEVSTQQGDAQNLPFENDSFDYIVSRNLVWNLEEPERAYGEWIRILKPGGRLLVVDGNHYLYYFDEEYLRAREYIASEDKHNCHGVDPTPINEIARDLPLSRVRRPDWDLKKLLELGMERVSVDVSRKSFFDQVSREEKSIISDFLLCSEKPAHSKPLREEEQQREINEHWTKSSDNYNQIIHDELSSFRVKAWIKKITENAPQKPILDVLDAGCGPAFFSIVLSEAGHRVVGLDGASGMITHAAKNAKEYNVSPLFIKGDCHELPFGDDSFDLVLSRNVTHALRKHSKVYSEWFRVLRPDGKLLIFDANWHLMQTDPNIINEFAKRQAECIRIYGSTFSGGKDEAEENKKKKQHLLKNVIRPDWDIPILKKAGFTEISWERNIIEELWDDKEKLLYGATPMFMISAVKIK